MKIVVAPDKFKGSLTAPQAAAAMGRGILKVLPDAVVDFVPMADGGEGTVDALVDAAGGERRRATVEGPLGELVEAEWGVSSDASQGMTAVIEMSAASGLKLVSGQNRALEATTFGTGQLIREVLDAGCRRIILGIGGSATTDGGSGVAEALGIWLLDSAGRRIRRGGGGLTDLDRIDASGLDPRVSETEVLVATDVDNLLCGPEGAASIYGPQKGATAAEVSRLEKGLQRLGAVINRDLGIDVLEIAGAGAAGGLGAGMIAFAGARLAVGVELISDLVDLPGRLAGADLAITGEGQIDGQTVRGKVPIGVARLAREQRVPTVAVAGSIGSGVDNIHEHGILAVEPICIRPMTLEEAVQRAAELVESATERLLRALLAGRLLRQEQSGNLGPA